MDTNPSRGTYPPDYPSEPTDPVERERLLAEAEADVDAGNGISHEDMRIWLDGLIKDLDAGHACRE